MPDGKDFEPLLEWACHRDYLAAQSPTRLADNLTCENAPNDEVPDDLRDLMTAYRHKRTDARIRLCRRFLLPHEYK